MQDTYVPLGSRPDLGYGQQFLAALDRALRVKPRERTASMTELRADLGLQAIGERAVRVARTVLAEDQPQRVEPSLRPDVSPSPGRRSAIAGLAVLAAGGAGAAWWWSGRSAGPPAKAPDLAQTTPSQAPALAAAASAQSAGVSAVAGTSTSAITSEGTNAGSKTSAVASAATATPQSAQQGGYDVAAQFQRIVAAQTPGFVVEATATQPVLKIGKDLFGWRIRSARDGFVHILSLGADGALLLLFPNRQDRNQRILAGQTLGLPRDTWRLAAAEPSGREEVLIFVSAQPRSFDGLGKRYLDSFLRLPSGEAAASVQAGWPHATPWLLGAAPNCTGDGCDAYGAATVTVEVIR
jgi:hypothetical protein